MKAFLLSKFGVVCLCGFTLMMAVVLQQVVSRSLARKAATSSQAFAPGVKPSPASVAVAALVPSRASEANPAPFREPVALAAKVVSTDPVGAVSSETQENLPYLDTTRSLSSRSRVDRDRQGRQVTRRRTSRGQAEGRSGEEPVEALALPGLGMRLKGHVASGKSATALPDEPQPAVGPSRALPLADGGGEEEVVFCPFGRPIKCELVFTIDSTMEETPLVGLVMEPVYNNGRLVIPAGAELHGVARPDRLRDRIFSGQEWMLIMPRMEGRPNGRQLAVQGLALDRVEPDENGLTWGITDGSYGLQGAVMRSLQEEELKRFAATFLSAAAFGLQEREGTGQGRTRLQSTPRNAALQGLGNTLEEIARKIGVEIEQHGVFIRVAGGKQFYFYPKQAIFPNRALVPLGMRKEG